MSLWYNNTMRRLFQDDLPSVSISAMRSAGLVTLDMEWIDIAFGEGDDALRRRVPVTRLSFQNGGSWSLFVCPACGGLARVLRLHERPMCRRCCLREGIQYRIAGGSPAERAEARARRIEKLRARLAGGPARLHPRPGRTLDRRGSLEMSLRRAMVAARQDLLR
jgi:hypothetical protein